MAWKAAVGVLAFAVTAHAQGMEESTTTTTSTSTTSTSTTTTTTTTSTTTMTPESTTTTTTTTTSKEAVTAESNICTNAGIGAWKDNHCDAMKWSDVCEAGPCEQALKTAKNFCGTERLEEEDVEMKVFASTLLDYCTPCMWTMWENMEGLCEKCEAGCFENLDKLENDCVGEWMEIEGEWYELADHAKSTRPDLMSACAVAKSTCMEDYLKIFPEGSATYCQDVCEEGSMCRETVLRVSEHCTEEMITWTDYEDVEHTESLSALVRPLLGICHTTTIMPASCKVISKEHSKRIKAIEVDPEFCGGDDHHHEE